MPLKSKYTSVIFINQPHNNEKACSYPFIFLSFSILFSQVPQAVKYQAVARDAVGGIMSNAKSMVRVSVIDPEYSHWRQLNLSF